MRLRPGLAATWLFVLATAAGARIVEQQFPLPVSVRDAYGKLVEQPIVVTWFVDDTTPEPRPLLVLNHGRATTAEARVALGRARYSDTAAWFARQGFAVAVPTRVGYGVSGGADVEDSGACQRKNYPPGYAAAAQQVEAVLAAMRERPGIAAERSVVVGQSYGGATAIAIAARAPAGVLAAINFAGGGGGDPVSNPGRPCLPGRLESLFAGYGESARMPTLWIYTENDRYFGAEHPREWFDAFRRAGGQGEFVQLPPHGEDGHALFTGFPRVWRPVVAEFLRRQGFEIKE